MKIKSIATICKKNKQVVLFNRYSDSGTISQYIGDGSAVYPISGLPELDEESILTIFDVPEKQREDWLVRYRDIPEGISFEDTDATEKIIEQGNLSIVYSGKTLKPLQTRRGLVFIESRYLSPVSDVLDVLELYERVTPFGAPYIVAKAGFLLQAVIMPCDVISTQFVQRLQELTRQCAVSLDLREQEREQIVELGSRRDVFENPLHPYTKRLMSAVPIPDPSRRTMSHTLLTGEIPSPVRSADYEPVVAPLKEVSPGHSVSEEQVANWV